MMTNQPKKRWLRSFAWFACCFILAAACAIAWAKSSKSEVGEEGNGLVALQQNEGRPPFIFRRLGPEASLLLWKIVPDSVWSATSELLHQDPRLSREVTNEWEWSRDDEPRLLAHLVILIASFVVFAVSARTFISSLYEAPSWVRSLLPLALMLLLVGGKGYKAGWHAYAYDIPNVAAFWVTLALLVRGNFLAVPAMALAAYSKETSILLAPAAYLVWPAAMPVLRMALAGLLAVIYVCVRYYIHSRITAVPYQQFSYVLTNGFDVLFPGNWVTFTLICILLFVLRDIWSYPAQLRRLGFIPLALLGVLTVKGWIYEQRAYLEGMPIVVLMVTQSMAMRYGRQDWLLPRDRGPESSEDGLDGRSIRDLARDLYVDAPPLRRWMAVHRSSIAPLRDVLLQVPSGSTLLDVGTGNGLLLNTLVKRGVVTQAIGVDINPAAIAVAEQARQRLGPLGRQIEFASRAPEHLLPDQTFDCVLLVDVLHHVPKSEQTSFLQSVAERVRPGGRLIYKDVCRRPWWRATLNRLHDLLTERQWVHYYDVRRVDAELSAAGFECVHRQDIPMLWYGHELRVFEKRRQPTGHRV